MHRKIDEAWLNPIEHNLQIMLLKTEPQVKHTCDTVRNTKDNLQQKQSRNRIRTNLAKPCQAFAFWFWQFWFWSCRSLSKFFVQRLVQLWLWDTLSLCPTAVRWHSPLTATPEALWATRSLLKSASSRGVPSPEPTTVEKKKGMERVEWVHCVGPSWIDILTWVIIVILLQGCLVLRSMMLHDIHMVSLWVSIVSFVNPLMSNRGWLSWAWLRIPKVQIATVMYSVIVVW